MKIDARAACRKWLTATVRQLVNQLEIGGDVKTQARIAIQEMSNFTRISLNVHVMSARNRSVT